MRRLWGRGLVVLLALGASACDSPTHPTLTATPTYSRIIELSGNLAFGNVPRGQTATRTLTIGNSGKDLLTVSRIESGSTYFIPSKTSGAVTVGGTLTVTITFAPSLALSTGNYTSAFTVTSDATNGANTIAVSGAGS